MKKLITVFFVLFFIAFSCREQELRPYSTEQDVNAVTRSQETVYTPSIESVSLTESDKAILDKHLSKYTAFTLDLHELAGHFKSGTGSLRLQIDEELDWIIDLELNDLRAPDFKATITTGEGVFEDTEPFVVNTYKGFTSDGKIVRFTIDENLLFGVILGENYHYVIRSANDYTQNSSDKSLVLYKNWDIIPDDSYSDYVNDALEVPKSLLTQDMPVTSQSMPLTRAVPTRSIKIAIDVDYEFYQAHGANSKGYISNVMNVVDGAYESAFGLSLYVTFRNIYTTSSQPYTSTNADTLLNSFRNYWNANLRGVNRHIAHLFTGKDLNSRTVHGYAWIGDINGNTPDNYAYSLTTNYDLYIEYIAAHEIGHNLGAWDNPSDGLCYTPSASVMCWLSGNFSISFSQQSKNEINNFLNAKSSSLTYILGPSLITGYFGNYTLQNAPIGSVTWSLSGSQLTVYPTYGITTSIDQIGSSGSGTLTAKVNGTVVATKSITVSSPALGPITGPSTVSRGSTYVSFRVQNNSYVPGLTYTWGSSGTLVLASNNGGEEGLFNVPSNTQGNTYDTVHCTVTTPNGTTVGVFYMNVTIM
ncbi:MAG: zinc-dependent metalloprotease [Bacteroidales bacterium]|jgi:hypothetical protein|nr:zinc-dependent metalloprotease [Bacteroidales bacterium]